MNTKNIYYDVLIIGGGYAGCITAICCARKGLKVAIFEKNEILGRKILSTGNGRCNFTNEQMGPLYLNSDSCENIEISTNLYKESLDFFNSIGIRNRSINGYYYPITNQAKTVRDAFEAEIKALGIKVFINTEIEDISVNDDGYEIFNISQSYFGKYIVLACGGMAAPGVGGSDKGYKLAKILGLNISELTPALTGFVSNDNRLKLLAGVRAQGKVSFGDKSFEGEIQFNKDGISGYPVMCLSRHITAKTKDETSAKIFIDFIPEYSNEEMLTELKNRIVEKGNDKTIKEALIGLIHEKIIQVILKDRHMEECLKSNLVSYDMIKDLAFAFKNFSLKLTKSKGFAGAQVTAGGVLLNQINLSTMEAKVKELTNLYIVGELLDVDGICGGYNLEWARHSAMCAANDIVIKHDSN